MGGIKSSVFYIGTVCALVMMAGFVAADNIKNDYSPSVDFTQFQTFMWMKQPECVNDWLKQQIVDGINVELESKGLYLTTGKADLAVVANVATGQRYSLKDFYEAFPPEWNWQRYLGPGSETKFTDMYKSGAGTYKPGTLVVDLFNTRTKRIVWWGKVNEFVYEDAPEGPHHIIKVFQKMFSGNFWWITLG